MKQLLRFAALSTLMTVSAAGVRAEESKRGFYEGALTGGGKIVFFVQANHSLSTYIFDAAGHQASFGGGPIAADNTFNIATSANATVTGTVSKPLVTANVLGQNITANRVSPFGNSDDFGGRFTATARSASGVALEVKFVIDSQNNIFLVTKQAGTASGGFGTITVLPSASPSPSPSPSPSASPSPSPGDDDDDDDHGGDRRRHGSEDNDEAEDHHEDRNSPAFRANFSVTLVSGGVVTGHLVFSDDLLIGDLTLNGVIYNFRAPKQSADNHLANVSTRGFVTTGQGQLIGGFLIRGGPKLVMIRAIGPELANRGVTPALADPILQIFSGSMLLAENNDWQSAANVNEILASQLVPGNPKESTVLIRLEPGAYTAVIRGANEGSGIALVEVYEVDHD